MKNLILILCFLILIFSCGKKSSLDKPMDSSYPREYPVE